MNHLVAIVAAAGVGSRMNADRPKQYLELLGKTILEHTIELLLSHHAIARVVVALHADDRYFSTLSLVNDQRIHVVVGGDNRADSVLAALQYVNQHQLSKWVLVHDAARPCVQHDDIDKLINAVLMQPQEKALAGGILAAPVCDTMKRSDEEQRIKQTIERQRLWHALTPQLFNSDVLEQALTQALAKQIEITDESSAMEWFGLSPKIVQGRRDNLKITQQEDLALAEFYLNKMKGIL